MWLWGVLYSGFEMLLLWVWCVREAAEKPICQEGASPPLKHRLRFDSGVEEKF